MPLQLKSTALNGRHLHFDCVRKEYCWSVFLCLHFGAVMVVLMVATERIWGTHNNMPYEVLCAQTMGLSGSKDMCMRVLCTRYVWKRSERYHE